MFTRNIYIALYQPSKVEQITPVCETLNVDRIRVYISVLHSDESF